MARDVGKITRQGFNDYLRSKVEAVWCCRRFVFLIPSLLSKIVGF